MITDLGLRYNLLTDYTSFVAVDNLIRNETGESTSVKQALPLPAGVSDYAVGQSSTTNKTTPASLSSSYYYTSPLAFSSYGYFNTIDGYSIACISSGGTGLLGSTLYGLQSSLSVSMLMVILFPQI